MKKRLTYLGPWQVGKVQAVLAAVSSLIFVVPMFLIERLLGNGAYHAMSTNPTFQQNPLFLLWFSGYGLLLTPFLYAVFGFIFGVIAAAVYNLIAKWTGGVEFITEVVSDASLSSPPPTSGSTTGDPY